MTPARPSPIVALGRCSLLLLALVRPAGAAENLFAGDVGFEAGLTGVHLRDGFAAPPSPTLRVQQNAAEGRSALRLGTDARPAVLELPWHRLQPDFGYSFSAFLQTARPGLVAALRAIPATGEPAVAEFALSGDWRRYAVEFTAAAPGWYRFEIGASEPTAGPAVVVDGLKLEQGEATPFEPRPALAVELAGDQRLLRAGARVDWQLRLSVPAGGRFPLSWRLEDPFGAAVRTGMVTVTVAPGGAATVPVRVDRIEPGAWRLVARAALGDRELVADSSLVALTPQLGPPEQWIGVEGVVGPSGFEAVQRLRIGLLRGAVGPNDLTPLPAPVRRTLLVERRGGLAGVGYLPFGLVPERVRERVGELRDVIGTWELPPGSEDGRSTDEYLTLLAQTAAAARAAQPEVYLFLLRLAAAEVPARLEALVAAGALESTSAIGLTVPPIPPEQLAGGLREAVEVAARLATTEAGPRPVAVLQAAWPAEPWSVSYPPAPPMGEVAARVDPLVQASLLIRSMLLSRAGGAAGYFYQGAPLADRLDRLTLGSPPAGDLYDFGGRPLPAVAALDQVLDHLRGREIYATVPLGPETACLIWGGRRPLATLWQWHRPGDRLELTVPLAPSQLSATDLFGRPVMLRGERSVVVPLTDTPLYLTARVSGTALVQALREANIQGLPEVEADLALLPDALAVILRSARDRSASGRLEWPERQVSTPFVTRPEPVLLRLPAARRWGEERSCVVVVHRPGEPPWPVRRRLAAVVVDAAGWQPVRRLYAGFATGADDPARFQVRSAAAGLEMIVEVLDAVPAEGDRVEVWVRPDALAEDERHLLVLAAEGTRTATGYRVRLPLPPPAPERPYALELAVIDAAPDGTSREYRWHESARGAEGLQRFGWLLTE